MICFRFVSFPPNYSGARDEKNKTEFVVLFFLSLYIQVLIVDTRFGAMQSKSLTFVVANCLSSSVWPLPLLCVHRLCIRSANIYLHYSRRSTVWWHTVTHIYLGLVHSREQRFDIYSRLQRHTCHSHRRPVCFVFFLPFSSLLALLANRCFIRRVRRIQRPIQLQIFNLFFIIRMYFFLLISTFRIEFFENSWNFFISRLVCFINNNSISMIHFSLFYEMFPKKFYFFFIVIIWWWCMMLHSPLS